MNNLDLRQFNTACDDFIAGKYILANIKVKALINAISSSEKLTDLVSACLDGFDFNLAMRESMTPRGIVLPQGDKNVVAFCFSVLYGLDDGSVTFLDFLNKYFASAKTSGGQEFKMFTDTIITPFKLAVNNQYKEMYEMTSSEDYQNNLYHKLANVASANLSQLEQVKLKEIEKEELQLLLTAIQEASQKNDKKLIYTLMVGLEYFVKANKRAKDIYLQLKDCFTRN